MCQLAPSISLSLTEGQHAQLLAGLFKDENENVAFLLCGQRAGDSRYRLVAKEVLILPEEAYIEKSPVMVTWNTDAINELLDKAERMNLSVIKIHSHPTGFRSFSETDDISDNKLFPCIKGWVEADIPHASTVMLPSGEMFGRSYWRGEFKPLHLINIVGHDLKFWLHNNKTTEINSAQAAHSQAFGEGTTKLLKQLSVGLIGCSGTGSIIGEQMGRLCTGKVSMADPEKIEDRNLNRILNSGISDVGRYKTEILAESIKNMGLGTDVKIFNSDICDADTMKAMAECDILFGCVDSHLGRYIANRIATFYNIPYFDVGVRLDATSDGNIRQITGCVSYLIPGGSSLLTRGKINMDAVDAEYLLKNDPAAYEARLKEGYIRGAQESRPAVISINMYAASLMANDFLARLHPYREEANSKYAEIEFCLSEMAFYHEEEVNMEVDNELAKYIGAGDTKPLLMLPGMIK